jgi:hypothetical protein
MAIEEQVCLEMLTRMPLASRDEGDLVLRLWEELLPEYLPDKFGNWEPIDRHFDLTARDAILDQWCWPFLTVKRKPEWNRTFL